MLSAHLILQAREKKGQTHKGGITHGGENATPPGEVRGSASVGEEARRGEFLDTTTGVCRVEFPPPTSQAGKITLLSPVPSSENHH